MLKFYKKGKDEVPAVSVELQIYNQTSHEGTDTTETINKGLNNNALEHDSPNLDGISIVVYDEPVESGKPSDEESPKERLKSSITNLSTLYRP